LHLLDFYSHYINVVTENKHQAKVTVTITPRLLFKTSSHTKYLSRVDWSSAEPPNMDMMGEINGTVREKLSTGISGGKGQKHSAIFL